jgi:lantibiotic modifying enzyme
MNPLLNPNESKETQKKLAQIVTRLFEEKSNLPADPGLSSGKIGIAYFLLYYSRYQNHPESFKYGMELISQSFDTIAEGFYYPGFANGLAGIGWAMEHLVKYRFFEADTKEILSDLDDLLVQSIDILAQENNFSFLDGALGLGWYFLSRMDINNTESKKAILRLLDHLEQSPGNTELGIAHGLAGQLIFLSRLTKIADFAKKATPLLDKTIKNILDRQVDPHKYNCYFPIHSNRDEPASASKMEWASGDPGIATAIWRAGYEMKNNQWQEKAIEIFIHSCERKNVIDERVIASGLGKGTAGLAQIYHRMYGLTGRQILKETAQYWVHATVGMGYHQEGFAGYRVWQPKIRKWQPQPGLLEGISGIGLSLLSALTGEDLNWDQYLLL